MKTRVWKVKFKGPTDSHKLMCIESMDVVAPNAGEAMQLAMKKAKAAGEKHRNISNIVSVEIIAEANNSKKVHTTKCG